MTSRIGIAISLMMATTLGAFAKQEISIEFILFSGIMPPKTEPLSAPHTQAVLDSLALRSEHSVPYDEIPSIGSTALYSGVKLVFNPPVLDRKILIVRKGYIYFDATKPSYRDFGSNLEKLAVSLAFQYKDVSRSGNPEPMMSDRACLVPDSLHRDIAPCPTASLRGDALPSQPRFSSASLGSHPAFGLDGRVTGRGRTFFYRPFFLFFGGN